MPATGAWRVEGVIVSAAANGTYRVRLTNGHELVAFLPGRLRLTARRRQPGERVRLVVSSYDLSKGRIVEE